MDEWAAVLTEVEAKQESLELENEALRRENSELKAQLERLNKPTDVSRNDTEPPSALAEPGRHPKELPPPRPELRPTPPAAA